MLKIEKIAKNNPYLKNALGKIEQEEYEEAITELNNAAEREKDNKNRSTHLITIYTKIGECYEELEDYENAIIHFLHSKDISEKINDTDIYQFYGELGWLYEQTGLLDLAELHNIKAIEIASEHEFRISVFLNQASVYSKQKKQNSAQATLKKAIEEADKQKDKNLKYITHERLAEFYRIQKNYDEAINWYHKSMEHCDKLQRAVLNTYIAGVCEDMNSRSEAIEYYNKSLPVFVKYNDILAQISTLISLGHIYHNRRDFDKTILYYEEAHELIKNENDTRFQADILYNFGEAYLSIYNYKKAESYFLECIDTTKKTEEYEFLNSAYINIGNVYAQWGMTEKGIYYLNKALHLTEKLDDRDSYTAIHNNLAMLYADSGNFIKALKYQELALTNEDQNNAYNYSRQIHNKGRIYHAWADYETALYYYNKALDIARKHEIKDNIIIFSGAIATVLTDTKQYKKALKKYNECYNDRIAESDKNLILSTLLDLANLYDILEDYQKAMELLDEAKAIAEHSDYQIYLPTVYNNYGNVYFGIEDFKTAFNNYHKALELDEKHNNKEQIIADIHNIGSCYYYLKDYVSAIKYYEKSINLIEAVRNQAPLLQKQTYLANEIRTYDLLFASYIHINEYEKAHTLAEKSRARTLTEHLEKNTNIKTTVDTLQNNLNTDTIAIYYSIVENSDLFILIVSTDKRKAYHYPIKPFIAKISSEFKIERFIANNTKKLKRSALQEKDYIRKRQEKEIKLENIIQYYIHRITGDPDIFWSIDIKREGTLRLSRLLFDLLIEKVQNDICNYKNLLIIPEKELCLLPFESLFDGRNYLVEKVNVSYIQSLKIFSNLTERKYSFPEDSLLAFGGAVYNLNDKQTENLISHEDEIINLRKNAQKEIKKNNNPDHFYYALGISKWTQLPHSLDEVNKIGEILSKAEIYKGDDVNVNKLFNLNTEGRLKQFKIIHFATHGISFTTIPELSALVLSPTKEQNDTIYLISKNISSLDICADFVMLSACESGLGRVYAGEGVIGILKSFFEAGAKSAGASLWEIADEGTSYIMKAFYESLQSGITYCEALNEIKRQCIKGKIGEVLKNPYYWASFVFYGENHSKFTDN